MKINTKTASPIQGSPNSFLNENKCIPTSRLQEDDEQPSGDVLGREILYETVVVSTPVLASARINNNNNNNTNDTDSPEAVEPKRLLSKSDLDELNEKLQSLYIGSPAMVKAETPEKPTMKVVKEETTIKKVIFKEETKDDYDDAEPLGRFEKSIFDTKSKTSKVVFRSVRLLVEN